MPSTKLCTRSYPLSHAILRLQDAQQVEALPVHLRLEFDSQDPHNGGRKPTGSLLTSTSMLWHVHPHIHMDTNT